VSELKKNSSLHVYTLEHKSHKLLESERVHTRTDKTQHEKRCPLLHLTMWSRLNLKLTFEKVTNENRFQLSTNYKRLLERISSYFW